MYLSTLPEWLDWIAQQHPIEMDLGLDRVKQVAEKLDLLRPLVPVITVGGTNGKGTTVAALEAIYQAAGFKPGVFTSPTLFKHNEYVRSNGVEVSDEDFCQAYQAIEANRGKITLTPFEYHTLAALFIFKCYPIDVMLLEVGLGGRLDAVNMIDTDVAIITSISLDHTDLLGTTREAIGFEKAGIARAGKPIICGDREPPQILLKTSQQLSAPFYGLERDFFYHLAETNWSWQAGEEIYLSLPLVPLVYSNLACALMTITLLQSRLPTSPEAIRAALKKIRVPGRTEVERGAITKIWDVAHNPAAISVLSQFLKQEPCSGKTIAVFSMLADKDIQTSVKMIAPAIDEWYIAPLYVKRGASLTILRAALQENHITAVNEFSSLEQAFESAMSRAKEGDRVVIFGSFHTVSEVKQKMTD
jgi:dihydrofolate synthase / folylpolyglutamate synthase